nr:MAG TPA: hypothetical protein [Caudoviricetes sp.]
MAFVFLKYNQLKFIKMSTQYNTQYITDLEKPVCSLIPKGYSVILPLNDNDSLYAGSPSIIIRSTGIYTLNATNFPYVDENGTLSSVNKVAGVWIDNTTHTYIKKYQIFASPLFSMDSVGDRLTLPIEILSSLIWSIKQIKFPFLYKVLNKIWAFEQIESQLDSYTKSLPKNVSLIFKSTDFYETTVIVNNQGLFYTDEVITISEDNSFQSNIGLDLTERNTNIITKKGDFVSTEDRPIIIKGKIERLESLEDILKFDLSFSLFLYTYLSHFSINEIERLLEDNIIK